MFNDFIDLIKKFWSLRYSIKGLFSCSFLWALLVLLELYPLLRDSYQFFKGSAIFNIVLIFSFGEFFILCYWLFIRSVPKFKSNEIGIIFALSNKNKKTDNVILELYNAVNSKLKSEYKELRFNVKQISAEIAPATFKEAYKILDDSGATLLVWGNLEKGKEVAAFMPIRFTHLRPGFSNLGENNEYKDKALDNKKWVMKYDDIFEIENVSNNISNFVRYIIAYSLTNKGAIEQSVIVIKESLPLIIHSKDLVVENRLRSLYLVNRMFTVRDLNFSYKDKDNKSKIERAKILISEMLSLHNPNGYMLKAMIEFVENKTGEACNSIVEAKRELPSNDSGPYYSMAFLQFYKGELEYGWNQLVATFSMIVPIHLTKIIEFYEEVLEIEKNKYILNFPLGVLYYKELGENKLAKENIRKFLKKHSFGDSKWETEIKELCNEIIAS